MAIPRRVCTNMQITYVAESIVDLFNRRDAIGGLSMTYEALLLRRSPQDAEKVPQRRSRFVQRLHVPKEYASPLRSLRPCWTRFLSILRRSFSIVLHVWTMSF